MNRKTICCLQSKRFENKYGQHMVFYLYEQLKPIPAEADIDRNTLNESTGKLLAKVTYHIATNSITIAEESLDADFSMREAATYVTDMFKEDFMKQTFEEFTEKPYVFKPIWSKQLGSHFM